MEKVLSGVLTPSIAPTWSKPLRSSTSLPHMPSAHHPPPHPGKLSSATLGVFWIMCLCWLWCCRKLLCKPDLAHRFCLCQISATINHLFTGLVSVGFDLILSAFLLIWNSNKKIQNNSKVWRVTINFLFLQMWAFMHFFFFFNLLQCLLTPPPSLSTRLLV